MRLLKFFVLALLLSSCAMVKRTHYEKIEVIKIPLSFKISLDTVLKVSYGSLGDTIKIENKVSYARTYFDKIKGVQVLELKGKTFNYEYDGIKKTITRSNEVIKKRVPFLVIVFSVVFILLYGYLIIKK